MTTYAEVWTEATGTKVMRYYALHYQTHQTTPSTLPKPRGNEIQQRRIA